MSSPSPVISAAASYSPARTAFLSAIRSAMFTLPSELQSPMFNGSGEGDGDGEGDGVGSGEGDGSGDGEGSGCASPIFISP